MPRKPDSDSFSDSRPAPEDVRHVVEDVFRKSKQGSALTVNRLRQHWAGIVGEPLAKATYPTRLARGVLWIAAPDSGWAFNLQFVKADVLNAVRTFLGSDAVREVRFKVDGTREAHLEAEAGSAGSEGARSEPADSGSSPPEPESGQEARTAAPRVSELLSLLNRPKPLPEANSAGDTTPAAPSRSKTAPPETEATDSEPGDAGTNVLTRMIARMAKRDSGSQEPS